jgi:hypothetical protein
MQFTIESNKMFITGKDSTESKSVQESNMLNDNLNSILLLDHKFALSTSKYGNSDTGFVGLKSVRRGSGIHEFLVFCSRRYNSPIRNEIVYFNNILTNAEI